MNVRTSLFFRPHSDLFVVGCGAALGCANIALDSV